MIEPIDESIFRNANTAQGFCRSAQIANMIKLNQNTRIILWTMPILLLCGLIIYIDNSLDACLGLVQFFGNLFLLLALLVMCIIFLLVQASKINHQKANRKLRIYASAMVLTATIFALLGKSFWQKIRFRNNILTASIYADQLDNGSVVLLDQEKYYAHFGHIDWSCSFTDYYIKRGDTLILEGEPFAKSDGLIADKYVLTDTALIPVKIPRRDMKPTQKMDIKKNN